MTTSFWLIGTMSYMLDLAVPLKVENNSTTKWIAKNARVAERQTRWLQVPVSERAWGFKSPLAHVFERSPVNQWFAGDLSFKDQPIPDSHIVSPWLLSGPHR